MMKEYNRENVTLLELAEIATPYDTVHSKTEFLKVIRSFPELEEQFQAKCSEEFLKAVEEKGVYFILDKVSWKEKNILKSHFRPVKPKLKLNMCGKERFPTISLDC